MAQTHSTKGLAVALWHRNSVSAAVFASCLVHEMKRAKGRRDISRCSRIKEHDPPQILILVRYHLSKLTNVSSFSGLF